LQNVDTQALKQYWQFMRSIVSLAKKLKVDKKLTASIAVNYLIVLLRMFGESFDLDDAKDNFMFWNHIETLINLEIANIDGITLLYVRNTLNAEFLKRVGLCRDETNPTTIRQFSFILIDLDHFKQVNDTYGHLVGDIVLRDVGSVILRHSRRTDLPGRWGGEEFGVIVEGGIKEACLLARRIWTDIESLAFKPNSNSTFTFSVTASIGVSTYKKVREPIKDIINRADQALYHAKNNGRNQIIIDGEYVKN